MNVLFYFLDNLILDIDLINFFFYLQYNIAIIVRSPLKLTELRNSIWDACSNFLLANYCMLKTDVKLDISSAKMLETMWLLNGGLITSRVSIVISLWNYDRF